MNIEITDRYGGNPPVWLTSCHGQCEALGYYPTQDDSQPGGWRFIQCPDCHGTGRVGWWIAVLRIPQWIGKGASFVRWAVQDENNPPDWNRWRCFKTALWCAWGADLQQMWRQATREPEGRHE